MKLRVIVCIVIILLLTGCHDKDTSGININIPILADEAWLTADGAFLNGVDLAVDEVNKEYSDKNLRVKTEIVDDGALYEKGVEMATKLSQDDTVTAVFNLQNFDVSKTTEEILSDSGKIAIFPYGAYDSIFQKDNKYLFCTVASFSDLGRAMASYAVNNGYKRIAVYHNGKQSQEELVTAFETALMNTGTKVVDYIPSISSESEFEEIYRRWKLLDVDCVLISQYGLEEAFNVLNIIREKDKKIPVIGEPIFNRANALAENKEAAEGMAVPSTLVIEDSEKLSAFQKKYRETYNKEADIWAVQGYDMLKLIADTAVSINTDNPEKIAQVLHGEAGYSGVGHQIIFNSGGSMVVDINKLPVQICENGIFK